MPVGCDFWAHVAASDHFPRTSPAYKFPGHVIRTAIFPYVKKIARKFDTVLNFIHSTARVYVFTAVCVQRLKTICLENMQFMPCVVCEVTIAFCNITLSPICISQRTLAHERDDNFLGDLAAYSIFPLKIAVWPSRA